MSDATGPCVLERGDFFELQSAFHEAFIARMAAQEQADRARKLDADAKALFVQFGGKYGFDPDVEYRFDKATLTLRPVPQTPETPKD